MSPGIKSPAVRGKDLMYAQVGIGATRNAFSYSGVSWILAWGGETSRRRAGANPHRAIDALSTILVIMRAEWAFTHSRHLLCIIGSEVSIAETHHFSSASDRSLSLFLTYTKPRESYSWSLAM